MTVAVIKQELKGVYGNDQTTGNQDIEDLVGEAGWTIQMTLDSAAGTDFTYGSLKVPWNVQILEVTVLPGAALTAADATANTYTLGKSDGAGGSITTVASVVTNVAGGSWVADTFKSFTLSATAANLSVSKGQLLTLKKTHASTGTVTPQSALHIRYRKV